MSDLLKPQSIWLFKCLIQLTLCCENSDGSCEGEKSVVKTLWRVSGACLGHTYAAWLFFPRASTTCVPCAELSGFLYYNYSFCSSDVFRLRAPFEIINPRANDLVEHCLPVLIHRSLWKPLVWGMFVCVAATLERWYLPGSFKYTSGAGWRRQNCMWFVPIIFQLVFHLCCQLLRWLGSFPLRKCWLLQAMQDDKFPSLPLRCLCWVLLCVWFLSVFCVCGGLCFFFFFPCEVFYQLNSSGDWNASATGQT